MNIHALIVREVWRPYIWALAIFVFFYIGCCSIYWNGSFDLGALYSQKLRSELFSGLLAVGAFLLAVKTFILIELKKGVYENLSYRERYNTNVVRGHGQGFHKPFTNLGRFLVNSVLALLVIACMHVTVGLIDSPVAYITALSATAAGLVLLFFSWWYLRANLSAWFDLLDDKDMAEK